MKGALRKLEWKPEYEVGVKIIDENHRKFVELLNDFVDYTEQKSCDQVHTDIFYSLIHYAEHYLIREEILLKNAGIQELTQHKQNHSLFFDKIKRFQENFSAQEPGICEEMYDFLTHWFNDHIIQYDKQIAGVLKEKGIS